MIAGDGPSLYGEIKRHLHRRRKFKLANVRREEPVQATQGYLSAPRTKKADWRMASGDWRMAKGGGRPTYSLATYTTRSPDLAACPGPSASVDKHLHLIPSIMSMLRPDNNVLRAGILLAETVAKFNKLSHRTVGLPSMSFSILCRYVGQFCMCMYTLGSD